jgi:hypothetical protein
VPMKRLLFIAMITLFSAAALSAQETQEIHKLGSYEFEINGHTRENALIREMDLKEGTEFEDLASLEKAVARQQQDLVNLRVFNDVSLTIDEGISEGEDTVYTVLVTAEDSWTIYPIPYPKYSSDDGFRLGLKVYYDNAFGSLNDLYLGTNITFRDDEYYNEWKVTEWTFNPQLNGVKMGSLEYDFSFMQEYAIDEKKDSGILVERYNYFSSSVSVGTKLNFGMENKFYYRVQPSIGANYGYSGLGYEGNKEPIFLEFSHGGGYSKVDWIGNFRQGFSTSVGNKMRYVQNPSTKDEFKTSVDADVKYYHIIHPRINYTTQLSGIISLNDELTGLGSNLRGVEGSTMFGKGGLFYSNDINFAVIKWEDVGEAQFQPFFDIGFAQEKGKAINWDEDLRYSTGADFILFLDKLKGLHARASVGVDLSSDLPFSDIAKYGLEITSSLAY